MSSRYPGAEELARAFRDKPSSWLREQLASGALTWEAKGAALTELERRGEQPSPPEADSAQGDGTEAFEHEDIPTTKRAWRWWVWAIVFILAFALISSQGTKPRVAGDQGFLWGVIFLQALLLTVVVAGVVSFAKTRSVAGFIGRIVMLAVVAVLSFGLWLCSSLARNGWGG